MCHLHATKIPPLAPIEGAAMKSKKSEPRAESIILRDISVTLVSWIHTMSDQDESIIKRTESCLEVEFKPLTFQIKIFVGSIKQQVLRPTNPIADG